MPDLVWRHDQIFYRCPATGYNVQAFVRDDASDADGQVYEMVTCTVCRRIHLVNAKTGHVAGTNSWANVLRRLTGSDRCLLVLSAGAHGPHT